MAATVYNTAWSAWVPVLAVAITVVGAALTLAWSLGGNFERIGAAIERNREVVEDNGVAIGRNGKAIERNAVAIGRNAVAIERNAEAIDRNAEAIAQVQESVAANAAAIAKLTGEFAEHTRRHDRIAGG